MAIKKRVRLQANEVAEMTSQELNEMKNDFVQILEANEKNYIEITVKVKDNMGVQARTKRACPWYKFFGC